MPVGLLDSKLDAVWSGTTGSAASTQVPFPFIISINNHNYLEDLEFKPWKRQAMRATTTQTTRTQADTSNEPGEQSLSTESLWRRTQDSWHLGAGQVYLDRKNSSEFSFRSSKGVNIWTQWQLSLLNDVTLSRLSANTNLATVTCGTHLYIIDGTSLFWTTDLITYTLVGGTPGTAASSICTDGHTVYVAYTNGIYSTTEGSIVCSQLTTTPLASNAVVRYTMGRLMVSNGGAIYNVTSSVLGPLPAPLFTSNYSNFVWTDFTSGNGVIFACGNCGNFGIVYSIQINTDGTSLAAPIVCGQLPNGETIQAIYGYAGSGVAVGTSLGWRFAEQSLANGVAGTVALTIGPLYALPSPVIAFAGFGRFIYGTYENYDGTSTGLFRMDPSQFVSDLAPAFASDIMAPVQGAVTSIALLGTTVVFSVAGHGFYAEAATYVASGSIDSGLITYGLSDNKVPVFVDLSMNPLVDGAGIQTYLSLNGAAFGHIGTITQIGATTTEFPASQQLCETIELREILTSDALHDDTPVLTRHTLRSVPAPPVPTDINVVIQLRERVLINDVTEYLKPSAEYSYLDGLRATKTISTLQIGNMGPFTVTLESIDWIPEQKATLTGELNGVAVITCRTVV